MLAAWCFKFDQFIAFFTTNFPDQTVGVNGSSICSLLQVVAVLNGHWLAADMRPALNIQFKLRRNDAAFVTHTQQLHISLVVATIDLKGGDFNLFDQLAFVSIHSIKAENHIVFVHMGRRITQRAKRVHGIERLFSLTLQAAIDALRFIHDNDRKGCLYQVDRLFTAGFLTVFIEVIHVLFVDGADGHHHDLNIRTGGKITHLA